MFENNLVIIEGCDATGKSTLAQRYVNEGYEYFHFSTPEEGEDTYRTYMTFLSNIDPDKKYVLDRFHLGEMVYGEVYRKGPGLSKEQFRNINLKISKFNHLLIVATHYPDVIKRHFETRGEDYTKNEDVERIVTLFGEQLFNSPLNTICYNYALNPTFKTKAIKTSDLALLEGAGSFEAKYMFVGDIANPQGLYADLHQAFDFGKSSIYLFKDIIKKLKIPLGEVYITNAYKKTGDNKETIIEELKLVEPDYLIVMGNRANELMKGIPYYGNKIFIPHPSYLQRFPSTITNFSINTLKDDLNC